MDLHFTAARPTEEERLAVESVAAHINGAANRRQFLLPVLHAIQDRVGWVSPGALNHASAVLGVPPAEAFGVLDFYALFSKKERPPVVAHVCDDIACKTRGAEKLCQQLEKDFGPAGSSRDGKTTWHRSPCLGMCELAPAALMIKAGALTEHKVIAPADAKGVLKTLSGGDVPAPDLAQSVPQMGDPNLRLLRRVGRIDPESLDEYRAHEGFLALRRAIEMGPAGVIREVTDSKLVGRGGAAFPTGTKWQAVRTGDLPRYLVCNADESEPGTFKDRVIMEGDPFSLIEAMTIAAFATGCSTGFLYIRGEYPLATHRLQHAIAECRSRGFLGANILGSGFDFDIELRRGAGAYICGEETALINSIEGLRGEPRNKPPFPVHVGLFGKPTVINNVETLVNVLDIVIHGGAAFAKVGTEKSTGYKLFCLSGPVNKPGIYEYPFGITLRQLLEKAGGVSGTGKIQAILLGGAAGVFVTEKDLDIPLTFEGTRAAGATLGSAVIMVFDTTVDMREVLLRIASFFRDESCGQCVPCRVGTVRQEELLHRLATNKPIDDFKAEMGLLKEVGQCMRDASICGLGQTASSAIESAFAKLPVFQENR